MSGRTLSFRALSGTYSNAPFPRPPSEGNLVAFYYLAPTNSPSSFARDISQARIGGIGAFCFVIAQTFLPQATHILAPYLSADFNGLSFCVCVADADNNADTAILRSLEELTRDGRYLRRDGNPVVVLDTLSPTTDLSSWRTRNELHLVHAVRNRPLPPLSCSYDAVLKLENLENVESLSQYISHIERSIESEPCRAQVYYAACPLHGRSESTSLLAARLFGIWLYYLRMIASGAKHPGLVFIEGWNSRRHAIYTAEDNTPNALRLLEEIARSSWALPPHATNNTLSLQERLAADLIHATQQALASPSSTSGEYRGRTRVVHTVLNWLRSFESIHRPLRSLRNALASMTGGAR
jgi:hypothetical protein